MTCRCGRDMALAEQTARLAAIKKAKEAYEAACVLLCESAHTKGTQLLRSCLQVSCCMECKHLCKDACTGIVMWLAEPNVLLEDAKLVVKGSIA